MLEKRKKEYEEFAKRHSDKRQFIDLTDKSGYNADILTFTDTNGKEIIMAPESALEVAYTLIDFLGLPYSLLEEVECKVMDLKEEELNGRE